MNVLFGTYPSWSPFFERVGVIFFSHGAQNTIRRRRMQVDQMEGKGRAND
jgi:hypothetical protein